MSKQEKLIVRIKSHPTDFTWEELMKLLTHFGYSELKSAKTSGSRRKFVGPNQVIISLHKPHPDNIVKPYALKQLISHLGI
ncbi:MAG: type II toxin-antitoxin system HicA family toxin [Bacteroidota bacterium]